MNDIKVYAKRFRKEIGFPSQQKAELFLKAKDIEADYDHHYATNLVKRIAAIICRLHNAIPDKLVSNLDTFIQETIYDTHITLQKNNLIFKLNNQGRRPEEVLFSWLRGYATCEYFVPHLAKLFGLDSSSIGRIGDDSLDNPETFKKTPTADLQLSYRSTPLRIEFQSAFQSVNDIKKHKFDEAARLKSETGTRTLVVHADLFRGVVAFVLLDIISEDDLNFVRRQQMEGQLVYSIPIEFFSWRLLDGLPSGNELDIPILQ